eukprot:2616145-Rhodomonas_salina.2
MDACRSLRPRYKGCATASRTIARREADVDRTAQYDPTNTKLVCGRTSVLVLLLVLTERSAPLLPSGPRLTQQQASPVPSSEGRPRLRTQCRYQRH